MAETIAPSQTPPQRRVRESASPRGAETDIQPVAVRRGQNLPGILRRANLDIRSLAPAEILTLQRTIGNQGVLRLLASSRQHQRNGEIPRQSSPPDVRAKLTIGAPDDVYEKEADSVAEDVISNSSMLLRQGAAADATGSDDGPEKRNSPRAIPELRRKCSCGGSSEEECPECRIKRVALQRLSSGGDAGLEAPSIVDDVLATPGQPLAESARRTLEPGFGQDFSHVRVHEGSKAAESASAVNAVAYTVGNHIVFAAGQYAPETKDANRQLAHELTHTVQQTGGTALGRNVARLTQTQGNQVQRDSEIPDQTDQPPTPAPADQAAGPAAASQTPDDSGPVSLEPIKAEAESQGPSVQGGCEGLSLHGTATPTYRRSSSVENQVAGKGESCDCARGVQCLHVTGTLVTNYSVSVAIGMPSVPSGLTPCERAKVHDFLNNVLKPHELDHKAKFEIYNGQTKNPLDTTGCGRDGTNRKIGEIQDAENTPRQAAAQALSDSIDPFQRTIDCSDCQKQSAAPSAGQGAAGETGIAAKRLAANGHTALQRTGWMGSAVVARDKILDQFGDRGVLSKSGQGPGDSRNSPREQNAEPLASHWLADAVRQSSFGTPTLNRKTATGLHDAEELGDAAREFCDDNKSLGDDAVRKIRNGIIQLTSSAKTYEVGYEFFDYYTGLTGQRIVLISTAEEAKAKAADRLAETDPGGNSKLRSDVLGFSDLKLAALLLHEFSHTGHDTNVLGSRDYEEGQSYGIEYFYAEIGGDADRMKKIEDIVSGGAVVNEAQKPLFWEQFKMTYALMSALREVVANGSSAKFPPSSFPDLNSDKAQLLQAQVEKSFQNPSAELARYIDYVRKNLGSFKIPPI